MFVTWILNKRAGVLNKEQINLSERTRYDIFVVSCELPVGVSVEDRKESGPWKYYKVSNSRHRSREPRSSSNVTS